MKKRIFCITMAATLLSGCGETDNAEPQTTSASTTAATTSATATAAKTSATEPVATEQDGGSALQGVVLTEEQKELRKLVSCAKAYCDFEELGVKLTENSGFADKMRQMCGASPESACHPRGCDEEFFYFEIIVLNGEDHYDSYYNEYNCYYFELNCDSGEIAQIYQCENNGYRAIEISKEAILLGTYDYYYGLGEECKLIHRKSGNEAPLGLIMDSVLIDDTLYYEQYTPADFKNGTVESYRLYTMQITESTAIKNEMVWHSLQTNYCHGLKRGVYNLVFRAYDGGFVYRTITGADYICGDDKGRIRDYVFDTYYHCSAVMESNLLGWRSRLSIFDRNENETLLTIAQTKGQPDISLHATEDGIIFLGLAGEQIVLVGEKNCFNDLKAAFLPNDVFPEHYTVYYDNNRLYFYTYAYGDDKEQLVTLSK